MDIFHTSITLIKRAHTLGIHMFCLPPNTTYVLQPLDMSVFSANEAVLAYHLEELQNINMSFKHNKEHFLS